MKQLTLNIESTDSPYYLRLARALIHSIKSGQVSCTERLPSARALAEQLSVNRHTVMRSYNELIAQGWIENSERRYYRVSQQLPIDSSFYPTSPSDTQHPPFEWVIHKSFEDSNFIKSVANFAFNFAGGKPDTDLFPFDEYRSHVNDALRRPAIGSLHYGENRGYPPLLEQAETYLRRTRNLQDKTLMITNGSQEALYLIANLLLRSGDNIGVESLGYQPAWQAFKGAGANLVAIQQDSQGLCPQSLEKAAKQKLLKGIYLTPLHQYPTTVTLSASRRLSIYNIALRYKLFIIEDDYDHEYHYKCQPITPMAAHDPSQLVIYLSSLSKIMFPAARIGMLAAPPALVKALVSFRTTINHKPALLHQDALARWMASNGFERHIRRSTKAYQLRLENAQQQIKLANERGALLSVKIPDGGMALWIKSTVDSALLAQQLAKQSIYIQHQQEFSIYTELENKNRRLCHFRLGFAGQPIEQFNIGFSKIINLVLHLQSLDSAK